jgi:hypothetical protein
MKRKKTYIAMIAAFGLLVGCGETASASWFGASVKPDPSITLFGQTLTVPVPFLMVGKMVGTSFDASASSAKGAFLTLPYFKVGVQSPKLTVGVKGSKVSLSVNGISKAGSKTRAKKVPHKKKAKK